MNISKIGARQRSFGAHLFSLFRLFIAVPVLAFAEKIYVANSDNFISMPYTISVINAPSNTVSTIDLTGTPSPQGVAVSPDGTLVYVTNTGIDTVSVIDGGTNLIVATIAVGTFPIGVAFNPTGTTAYVANFGSHSVSEIDTASRTVTHTISLPGGTAPLGIAVTPDGEYVYVANHANHSVFIIDTATHMAEPVSIPVGNAPFGVAISPDGTQAYVSNTNSNSVSVIALPANTVSLPIMLASNAHPIGLSFNPSGTKVYVTNLNLNRVSVIDVASGMLDPITPNINVGAGPYGVAVTTDGAQVYVTNSQANTVSVIETATNTVTAPPIPVGNFPQGIGAIPVGILPGIPGNLRGRQKRNDFGTVVEYYNVLKWEASSILPLAVNYVIARDGTVIATLDALTFEYEDHDRERGEAYVYSVTAISTTGSVSAPASITIK